MGFAFHAREVRFERDTGAGFESVFPETFSFHAGRHDPTELYLRLDDLWSHPRRLHPNARRRDAEELMLRLLGALPGLLAGVLERLEGAQALPRAAEDIAVFALLAQRFLADKGLADHPRLSLPALHLRALLARALDIVVAARVRPGFLADYAAGRARAEPSQDPHDFTFFYALAGGDAEAVDRQVTGAAERAYHRWLEEVCLDGDARAFESEDSPFGERETEVLRAVAPGGGAERAGDLSHFLRRPGSRDCLRLLGKLETWFLRQYDIHHAAVIRRHAENLRGGGARRDRVLTRHRSRNYALALLLPALPFAGAALAYQRAPLFFDLLASLEVIGLLACALWFLGYHFLWKRDLTFFHSSVPRIGAGVIVGYLPVFLIDEVWDLAEQSAFYIIATALVLGATTFLYLYVEVQRRLGDPRVSFSRAGDIFMLGIIQAAGFGLLVTCLLGPLMAGRNWGPGGGTADFEALRALEPVLGELPRILGFWPFLAFPTAILLMSFLAFFIGTFLQLLWEDLPITEPL